MVAHLVATRPNRSQRAVGPPSVAMCPWICEPSDEGNMFSVDDVAGMVDSGDVGRPVIIGFEDGTIQTFDRWADADELRMQLTTAIARQLGRSAQRGANTE